MSFANYDLEAQQPPPNGTQHKKSSELDQIVSDTSSQVLTFGSLIGQFNSQRKLLGSKRDGVALRESLDLLQNRISDLDSAISVLIMNINKAMDPNSNLQVSERQLMQKERLTSDYRDLHRSFRLALDSYKEKKKSIPIKTSTEETPLLGGDQKGVPEQQQQQQQQQQLLQDQIEQTELQYHILLTEERNREIEQVAEGIREVNSIFKDLGTLVNQQGEQLDTVEENILELHGNTQQASRELHKAHEYQKRKGKWSCIILVVLSVIVLVIVLAVVS